MKHRSSWRNAGQQACPPDSGWRPGPPPGRWPLHRRGRFIFVRFALLFGALIILILAWMAALAFLLTRLFGGSGPTSVLVWIGGVSLVLTLPLVARAIATRTFRRIALPLADLIAAADAVADGNLSTRVAVNGRGDFARVAESFNHMTAELERSDQQRRNLTADVAHELRTPLHIIQGNLEGILDGVYEPTSEHINATLAETRTLARLVEDLRTLSQAEAGQLALFHEEVDIAELLADVETSFSGQAEQASIALAVKIEDAGQDLVMWGDPGRLDQVLSNVVVNAFRYTPPGGSITLSARRISSDRDHAGSVRITVSDTGAGIPAADLPFIFDRFWRGDPARSHARGAGSGLGLAITRQLVQAHGGHIEVESQVGQGTTFTIDLPRQPAGRTPQPA